MQDNEASADDVLAHYGVKGMRWGHRKGDSGGGYIARNQIRNQVNAQQLRSNAASVKAAVTVGSGRSAAKAAAKQQRYEYLTNPDRVTAATLSRGEKVAVAILVGSPLIGIAAVKAQNATANRIEYKQKTGAYDKKR